MTADVSEVDDLARDLIAGGLRTVVRSRAVLEVATRAGAEYARELAPGSRTARFYPASITGTVRLAPGGFVGEFGPDKQRTQGPLGNLFEFGSVNNGPMPHVGPAFDRVQPEYVKALTDAVGDVL